MKGLVSVRSSQTLSSNILSVLVACRCYASMRFLSFRIPSRRVRIGRPFRGVDMYLVHGMLFCMTKHSVGRAYMCFLSAMSHLLFACSYSYTGYQTSRRPAIINFRQRRRRGYEANIQKADRADVPPHCPDLTFSLSKALLNSSAAALSSSSLFRAPLRSNNRASLSAFNLLSSSLNRWIHLC